MAGRRLTGFSSCKGPIQFRVLSCPSLSTIIIIDTTENVPFSYLSCSIQKKEKGEKLDQRVSLSVRYAS